MYLQNLEAQTQAATLTQLNLVQKNKNLSETKTLQRYAKIKKRNIQTKKSCETLSLAPTTSSLSSP